MRLDAHKWATVLVACVVMAMAWFGIQLLQVPPIYRMVQQANPLFLYEGPALLVGAVLLAWFHAWVAQRLVWLCMELQRLVTALITLCVMGSEAFMHMLGIPHLEGWWLPVLTGGALSGAVVAYVRGWRKRARGET